MSSSSKEESDAVNGIGVQQQQPNPKDPKKCRNERRDVDFSGASSSRSAENDSEQVFDSLKKAAFVIGSALVIFVAARNTITWHLQAFWGASGDFYQRHWEKLYYLFGGDSFKIGIWGTFWITMGTFWTLNVILVLIDLTEKPAFLRRYKIQEDQKAEPSKVLKAFVRVIFNQVVIGIPFVIFGYYVMVWRGCSFGRELPTFPWVVWEVFVMVWVEELAFYYSHRLLHHPKLYRHIHKIHHEWTSPIGLVSLYAHPVEHIFSNLMPPLLGPVLCGSHVATSWMWYIMALFSTTIAHCGYHLPFFPSPEAHDFHHLKFNQNYGVLGILDRLHGTDSLFRKTKAYERHFMALSLVPVKEMIPDEPKEKCQ